ncbi:hypothetical protein FANTH_13945 [Fusarium anthophilum]|uniref:Uncharacterized protein n=1 Tax=Fusarium anthophilum TaxID=48485 RepID=A0A8H4YLS7_9HYPO|nr:hypothetical protein FANTH_13945 [Fusarium anthophilum]
MPSFSTTTDTDRVVASVLFMGAMQKYFSYEMCLTCRIPSVTLLGEISGWEAILTRLDRLDQLGKEPTEFAEMLRPVLEHIILSFEKPEDGKVIRFWNTIATRNPISSVYPSVDIDKVTVRVASVPVKINDDGNIISSNMVAGSFGIQASTKTQYTSTDSDSELNAIQPVSGWLMYEDEAKEATEAREEKKKALLDELAEVEKLPDGPNDFAQGGKFRRMISLEREIQELKAF